MFSGTVIILLCLDSSQPSSPKYDSASGRRRNNVGSLAQFGCFSEHFKVRMRRGGFGIRRQSVASLMVGSIIDLDLKPMCLIKLLDFSL